MPLQPWMPHVVDNPAAKAVDSLGPGPDVYTDCR